LVKRLALRAATATLVFALLRFDARAEMAPPYPRIREIHIDHEPVFGPDEKLDEIPGLPDLTFIFEIANFLHIDTKPQVIRRELLLKEGDFADPRLIEESERNLRALPFIRQVRILATTVGKDEVDLTVLAQDTWTTQPRASFSSGGGSTRSSFGFVESNVLGYGKEFRLLYRKGIDRSGTGVTYTDPRLLGSRFTASGTYVDTSDGRIAGGTFAYPFFSLDTPHAGGIAGSTRKEKNKVFSHFGDELAEFRRHQDVVNTSYAMRLPFSDEDAVWRVGAFYRWNDETFRPIDPDTPPSLTPANQRQSVPGLSLHRETVSYVRERHFELFDRIEDLNLGNTLDAELGYSWEALGARTDEPIFLMTDRQGFDAGPGRKAFLYGLTTGRFNDGDFRNAVIEVEGLSYYRFHLAYEHTLIARAKLDLARNLDKDVQIFLGSFNGLRGFDTRQFVGSKRLIFNLEDRVFFVNDLFHLVSLGAVVFFDTGYVWEQGQAVRLTDMATAVGIGLRVDALRGAGEALFRLDLAVPITDGGSGQHGPAVVFGTGQGFSPFVGPFDLQSTTRQ
jgi:outer membrane protein assembly factor BamA